VALGEEFADQIQPSKISPYEFLELRTGQEHDSRRTLKQDERGTLRKPCPFPQVGGDNQPPPVTHYHLIRPTHAISVPLACSMWESALSVNRQDSNDLLPVVDGVQGGWACAMPLTASRADRGPRRPARLTG